MAPNEAREFGKYQLVAKLAAGGMAITYRARMKGALGVTKPVVIKQILPHFADDPAFVEMFVSEARVAAALTHNNIAQVFDFGEIDGQYFLAMEFVHGQPLSKVLRRAQRSGMGGLPLPLALYIASQMCDGLDYAHRHTGEDGQPLGLVHRDVSPDNVLISYEGQVKVIDFGIAKATSLVEARTSPGTLKGKYPYFSTEQARGEQDLDARSDTFAVGVVLYEMVCGRRPYDGEFAFVLPRLLAGEYPTPSSLVPSLPPELEQVMAMAMALERDVRYPTAHAFSEALREQLHSNWPRFTPVMVTQLLGHLFAEELAAEGRKIEVPATFLEQLAAWQSAPPAPAAPARPRTGGGRTASSANVRASSPRNGVEGGRTASSTTVRSGSYKAPPPSASGRPTSNGGARSITSSSGRRVTSSAGIPRAQPTLAAPVDETEPLTPLDSSVATRAAPPTKGRDTPVEVAATSAAQTQAQAPKTPQQLFAEQQKQEAQERSVRNRRLARLLSIPLFGLALVVAVLYVISSNRKAAEEEVIPTSTLWLTSSPEGATVTLNGRSLKKPTPVVVTDVPLKQASTLVVTLPGHRPWTKRFTATTTPMPPVHAQLERAEPVEAPPPTPPAQTPDKPADATAPAAPKVAGAPSDAPELPVEFHVVDYPTRMFILRTRYNAFPIGQYTTASIELSQGAAYSVNTEGSVSLGKGRGGSTNTLLYLAEGDNLTVEESFGTIGPVPRTLKGMRKLTVFLVDDDLSDNSGSIRIHLRQSQWVAPREFTFVAAEHALVLQPEHQLQLRGLNASAMYLLTVRDDMAELRGGAQGRTRRVLCVESSSRGAKRNHRFLEAGKRFQVTGVESLRCTFPDTRVEDNAGAMEVDIVDVTAMSRQERAAALKGSSR